MTLLEELRAARPDMIFTEKSRPHTHDGKIWAYGLLPAPEAGEGLYQGYWVCVRTGQDPVKSAPSDTLARMVMAWCDAHPGELVPTADIISFLFPGASSHERMVWARKLKVLARKMPSEYIRQSTIPHVRYGRLLYPFIWGKQE